MILVINGSPNSNSSTLAIVNLLLKENKSEINILNAYDLNIVSCNDCKYCSSKIGCSKEDDMEIVHNLLMEADSLIISSPIYFGALSDQTMKIINRFQRYFSQKFDLDDSSIPSFNNLILVTSQGSVKKNMTLGAKETLRILSYLFNPKYVGTILSANADITLPIKNRETFKQIVNVKKKMITNS